MWIYNPYYLKASIYYHNLSIIYEICKNIWQIIICYANTTIFLAYAEWIIIKEEEVSLIQTE